MKRSIAFLDARQLAFKFEPEAGPGDASCTPDLSPRGAKTPSSPSSRYSFTDAPAGSHIRVRHIALASGAEPLAFRLRRAKRRSIGFQIDDSGLTVSAPRWVSLRDIDAAVVEKERWIRGKLKEWHRWRAQRRLPAVQWADGGTLPYLGETVRLRLASAGPDTALRAAIGGADRELHLALARDAAEQQIMDAAHAWLQAEAKRVFGERIARLADKSEIKPACWALSSARTQWGSCTEEGRIRLNWRLIHFALPVIDYVIAHELAHLKELNHGPRFWSAVAQLLPGFEAARREIKDADLASL